MNRKLFKILFLLAFTTNIGCVRQRVITDTYSDNTATIDKALNSWVGSSELEVITKFGTPDNNYTDSYGNKILRFLGKSVQSTQGVIYNNSIYSSSVSRQNYIDFIFNNSGNVINQRNNYPKYFQEYEKKRLETSTELNQRKTDIKTKAWVYSIGAVGGFFYLRHQWRKLINGI
jgi:hypothetical protein